jgi:predicted ATPase/transcriptional regulator with XRE-family HTH domain
MSTVRTTTFADLLRRHRRAAGLTQEELAAAAGLSVRAVSDLERGLRRSPHKDTVQLLADALALADPERAAFMAAARRALGPEDPEPVRALDAHPHNLPIPPTPLVGRERDVAEVAALLRRADVRLLTLTGVGGTGKTRLGVQVAAELAHAFADGVWFVPLSRLVDPALVVPTIAQTLGVREASGQQPIGETLADHLRDKQLLLVLDNCEHVAVAATEVAALLATCARLKVLATSRMALHLRGEKEYRVQPLPLPDPAHLPPLEQVTEYAAVALFVQRAQDAQPDFAATNATAAAIAAICARLDGLPLAIELAAAKVRVLPPPALLARLERQLPVLVGGARDLEARQQTMRNTLAWSYDLLKPEEQRLFRRLAVFVGGATLEAVEAVCMAPEGAKALGLDALEGLSALVDRSLVQQRQEQEEGGEARFRMLHVIREYADEHLEASEGGGEAEALRRAHAAYFMAVAEQSNYRQPKWPERAQWRARVEREHDNFRAALTWACAQEEVELGLRLGAALADFWLFGGYLREGRAWLEALLALEEGPTPRGVKGAARAEEVARRLGMTAARAWEWVLGSAGAFATNLGEPGRAVVAMSEESLAAARALGDTVGAMRDLQVLVWAVLEAGDTARGLALAEECVVQARQLEDDPDTLSNVLLQVGEALLLVPGEEDQVAALVEESLALAQRVSLPALKIAPRAVLALITRRRGDVARAGALLAEALRLVRDYGIMFDLPNCLDELALVVGEEGRSERAARLLGAAARERETVGFPPDTIRQADVEAMSARGQAALGAAAWAAAYAAGRALTREEAIAEALEQPSE